MNQAQKTQVEPTMEQIDRMMRNMNDYVSACDDTPESWSMEKAEEFIRDEHEYAANKGWEPLPYAADIVFEYIMAGLLEEMEEDE